MVYGHKNCKFRDNIAFLESYDHFLNQVIIKNDRIKYLGEDRNDLIDGSHSKFFFESNGEIRSILSILVFQISIKMYQSKLYYPFGPVCSSNPVTHSLTRALS